jgi:N-acetylglutamate synthase-like GNAT family acetyltransferase
MEQIRASVHVRGATPEDIPTLQELIDLSVRTLQAQDYSPAQIDGALGTVFGVDSQLIADGTYFVVEVLDEGPPGKIIGCGGWSKRKTLFGSDHGSGREDDLLDPLRDNARIRAIFVHPDWARRGIGSMLLQTCESSAMEAGFSGFELGATLTGERLCRERGYQALNRIEVPLANGASLPVVRMAKRISPVDRF